MTVLSTFVTCVNRGLFLRLRGSSSRLVTGTGNRYNTGTKNNFLKYRTHTIFESQRGKIRNGGRIGQGNERLE